MPSSWLGCRPTGPRCERHGPSSSSRGGVPATRIFTKIWLSLFDQWDWRGTPVMPPELIFLPKWFPVNIYDFSSWARATIVPMMIILSQRPNKMVPPEASIDEALPRTAGPSRLLVGQTPGNTGLGCGSLLAGQAVADIRVVAHQASPQHGRAPFRPVGVGTPRSRWLLGRYSTPLGLLTNSSQALGLLQRAPGHPEGLGRFRGLHHHRRRRLPGPSLHLAGVETPA